MKKILLLLTLSAVIAPQCITAAKLLYDVAPTSSEDESLMVKEIAIETEGEQESSEAAE